MAEFSLGGRVNDDPDSSTPPVPKRQRTTITRSPLQSPTFCDMMRDSGFHSIFVQGEEEREEVDEGEEEEEEVEEEEENEEEEEEESERVVNETRDQVGIEKGHRCSAGNDAISIILSDPDVLNCPICFESLTIPVFQCENGHIACNFCCSKLRNKCPSCSKPIGYNRNRAIEKVIEALKVSCENIKYGCNEYISYSNKLDHELVCLHAPCSCPCDGCFFVGSSLSLYQHFSSNHSCSAVHFSYNKVFPVTLMESRKHVILEEKNDGVIFVLNFSCEDHGTLVNVNCIGPSTSKKKYSYEVKVKKGESSVVLQSVTENVPFWTEHSPEDVFLLVPQQLKADVHLKVEVCIRPS